MIPHTVPEAVGLGWKRPIPALATPLGGSGQECLLSPFTPRRPERFGAVFLSPSVGTGRSRFVLTFETPCALCCSGRFGTAFLSLLLRGRAGHGSSLHSKSPCALRRIERFGAALLSLSSCGDGLETVRLRIPTSFLPPAGVDPLGPLLLFGSL